MTSTQYFLTHFAKFCDAFCGLLQGYFMVQATKAVVRQIDSQEINPTALSKKYTPQVWDYFRRVIMLVMLSLVIKAISGLMTYVYIDSYLLKEYDEDYLAWKNDNFYSADGSGYLSTPEETADYIDHVQAMWSVWGPAAVCFGLLMTMCCCGTVLCSFRKYQRRLSAYEESP